MNRYMSLVIFVAVVFGCGLLIGFVTQPGEWYAALTKPPFNPPNWIFGPVWSIFYILISVAGWRIWPLEGAGTARRLWIAQLVLNFLWSPVFFGLQSVGGALVIILPLLATIVAFIVTVRRVDRIAAWLFFPYALWVGFASVLNLSIWWLN